MNQRSRDRWAPLPPPALFNMPSICKILSESSGLTGLPVACKVWKVYWGDPARGQNTDTPSGHSKRTREQALSDENGNSTDTGKPPDNGVEDNSELGHLPLRKRKELARIVDIVRDEFEKKLKTATSPPRRGGKLLKILLFGSTARGDWVEDPKGGYYSDYDILLIVNEDVLTDVEFFLPVEAAIADDPGIRTDVTIIVHTLNQVNEDLRDGD